MSSCPKCNSDAVGFHLRGKRRKPVYSESKTMASCHACGEVSIAHDHEIEARAGKSLTRRWIRVIIFTVGVGAAYAEFWFDIMQHLVSTQMSAFIAMAFALLGIVEVILIRRVLRTTRHQNVNEDNDDEYTPLVLRKQELKTRTTVFLFVLILLFAKGGAFLIHSYAL